MKSMNLMAAATAVALLGACATTSDRGMGARVQRTAYGVVHVSAADLQTLAYGVAYAHAQDNVCQTAQQLVTIRGQRSRWFGDGQGQLGLRLLSNEQIDFFVAAHMDDAALARAESAASADARAMAAGYVAGYNRFLSDQAGRLPAACNGQPWVQPMTRADLRRLTELSAVQMGLALMADAMLAAQPPAPTAASIMPAAVDPADAVAALRDSGVIDPPFGSNAWALGREVTADGRGLLLGNPHFPWTGVNRFWQLHLTVPGQLDVMGASLGHTAVVQIGFNKDVAWSHTVSTGKRFTLHELQLVPGDPTRYLVDGQPHRMQAQTLSIDRRGSDGSLQRKTHTVWRTRWGPVIAHARAGLAWTGRVAYALQDANAGNARMTDTWLQINRSHNLAELQQALAGLGTPWVNTIAADRDGEVMAADASVVPDVDAALLARCAPSQPAQGLLRTTGWVVLDGSRSECDWQRDAQSPRPGVIPISRLPVLRRTDWVQNSNDSHVHNHPAARLQNISPLLGDAGVRSQRTRSSLIELPALLAQGKATSAALQTRLFDNRNLAAQLVLDDLLAACVAAPGDEARDGCAALRGWDRRNNTESRGAHLFREFWRRASAVPGVYAVPADPADPADPVHAPRGLKMGDTAVATRIWEALAAAVRQSRAAGFALDAPWGEVLRRTQGDERIALHGGDNLEGVLNIIAASNSTPLGPRGLDVDFGTSYVQTVGFDSRGPVAHALLLYGQSSDPASVHATDQLRLYARKLWPRLPFHADEVERDRVGPVLWLFE